MKEALKSCYLLSGGFGRPHIFCFRREDLLSGQPLRAVDAAGSNLLQLGSLNHLPGPVLQQRVNFRLLCLCRFRLLYVRKEVRVCRLEAKAGPE